MVVAVVGAEEALGVVTDTMDLVMVSVLFTSFSPMLEPAVSFAFTSEAKSILVIIAIIKISTL